MLEEHLTYVSDINRLDKYQKAIEKTLMLGDRVVDLGAGSGILGLMCLKAGAGHVVAIDSTNMLNVAQKTLSKAGYSKQCTFLNCTSLHTETSMSADLIICDQVGYFGFDAGITVFLRDAKQRLLKEGGCLIPSKICLHMAAAESEAQYKIASGWGSSEVPLEFHWIREHGINSKYPVNFNTENIISTNAMLGEINLTQNNHDFYLWEAELEISRDGLLHGLLGWFDCTLAPDIHMTNSPLDPMAINRPQAFFPISEAIQVRAGDKVFAKVMTRPADDLITWELRIPSLNRKFSHSNAEGFLAQSNPMVSKNPAHAPLPTITSTARSVILSYCDGTRTSKEITNIVLRDHAELMPAIDTLSAFVKHVLSRDAQ